MSTPKPAVTIVGLGLIGGSIGLALRQAEAASAVVGHDKEPSASKKAKKLGAVDRTEWNLVSACEDSDLIILSTPAGAIAPTLQAIGSYLRPGCVIMDTATLKGPIMASAAEILPEEVHFVGANPIISGPVEGEGAEAARADLFENGLFCVVPSPDADPNAVKLATDLIGLLGSRPLFVDPAEHDGMLAAVEHLPAVLAVALLEMVVQQPTWRELRKLAGPSFESITNLASAEPETYRDVLLSNHDNVLRWIDAFSASLASVRQALVEGEPEAITQRFEAALLERRKWLRDRAEGQWDTRPAIEERDRPNVLTDVFLGGLWRKRPKKDE